MTEAGAASRGYDRATEFRHEDQHLKEVVESIDAAIEERESRGPAQAGHAKAADILQELRNVDLQQLRSSRNRPYFGRIDYAEGDRGIETIYIGDIHVQNEDPRYFIASRNAPIAELYYRPADGLYRVGDGEKSAVVHLKRMLAIDSARLLNFDDVLRLPAGPDLLRSRVLDAKLAAAGGRDLAAAVQTIQPAQYQQIASTQQPVLIVQGAAGSGKSLIGLHRIDFILSPYSNIGSMRRPTAERVIMFGPSPAFLQYVSGLLPGLGVDRVRQTTTTKWMLSQFSGRVTLSREDRVFEHLMNNRRGITASENKAHRFKAGLGMKRLIDNYVKRLCQEIRERVNRAGGMSIARRPNVASNRLSASDLRRRVREAFGAYDQPNAARRHLVNALAREWARTNRRRDELPSEAIEEGRRAVERSLAPRWKAIDFRTEYAGLVSSPEKIMAYSRRGDVDRGMAGEVAKTAPPGAGQALGVTDLAAALYLDYALNGFRSQGFEHVVVDEAQDISPLEIVLMQMHSETRTFTILGDLRQSVLPHKSISNWNEIASLFPREGVSRLESRLTYRSTRQITQYANRILQGLPEQTKMPMPYRQSGDRPRLVRSRSAAEMRKAVADSVRNLTNREDVQTVAVLTKWRKTADDMGKALRDAGIESVGALTSEGVIETDVTVSPIVLTKGLEFDAVIVANVHKDNFNESAFDRMLLYLACTRARHNLEVHWYGTRSPIVPDVARLAGTATRWSGGQPKEEDREVDEWTQDQLQGGTMPGRLQNKVAIITGGATGIGRAASVLFAREGAKIVVADRNAPEAEKTVSLVRDAGSDAFFVEVDVSKAAQVSSMVEQAVQRYGRLDVLVNNAGVMIRTPPLAEVSELEWDLTMNTNLRGVFLCTKYAIPHMVQSGGAIVNVSSGAGTGPSPTAVPYGVSKAGVIQLTMTTSRQYAPEGIRCNVIVPGLIDTPQSRGSTGSTEEFERSTERIALGRVGTPQDIANLMLFLASEESSYISGSAFNINGGGSA